MYYDFLFFFSFCWCKYLTADDLHRSTSHNICVCCYISDYCFIQICSAPDISSFFFFLLHLHCFQIVWYMCAWAQCLFFACWFCQYAFLFKLKLFCSVFSHFSILFVWLRETLARLWCSDYKLVLSLTFPCQQWNLFA